MAYTPTEWTTGDVITAEKLNKMEDGIEAASGGGALVITANYSGASTGATPAEIRAAATAGTPLYIKAGTTLRPATLEEDGSSTFLEAQFPSLVQDPEWGSWLAYIYRWRIKLNTSSLSQLYIATQQLALAADDGGGMAEG